MFFDECFKKNIVPFCFTCQQRFCQEQKISHQKRRKSFLSNLVSNSDFRNQTQSLFKKDL
jgi:hypothetical protein